MLANNWKQNLHLEPTKGWLNDPNGLAYFKGKYHIFHQYSYEVNGGLKLWYYYTSSDLKNYEDRGVFLTPTIEEETHGVYSGSANIEDGKLVFYYTGNVKYKGDYDYVHTGRGHNTISFETEDGINFTEKKCLLTTDDYPNMSNHVRDPKIFEKNGKKYLVLGARDSNDYGCLLVYDKDTLKPYKTIYSQKNLGFMWECPDYFELDGKDCLIVSPMRYKRDGDSFHNINSSVFLSGRVDWEEKKFIPETVEEIDHGQDFYAPQTLVDDEGRRIMIAWMQTWGRTIHSHVQQHQWAGAMTLPRILHLKDGKLIQTPIPHGQYQIQIEGDCQYRIGNETDYLEFGYDSTAQQVYIDRSTLAQKIVGEEEQDTSRRYVTIEAKELEVFLDKNSIEIFVNQGESTLTATFYLTVPAVLSKI